MRNQPVALARGWLGRIGVFLVALALAACSSDSDQAGDPGGGGQTNNTAPRTRADTVASILENPAPLYNQTIILPGVVGEAPAANIFAIKDNPEAGQQIMVINTVADQAPVSAANANQQMLVTGMLRPFVRAEIEREYKLTIDPALAGGLEGQPVLIATTVASPGGPTGVGTTTPAAP